MTEFPRTMVGGVSLPRLLIGTNWFLGYSHTSRAKSNFIKEYQDAKRIADVIGVFMASGIDAVLAPPSEFLEEGIKMAEDQAGKEIIRILTPSFNIVPGGPPEREPERILDDTKELGATFCLPHQCVTDALIDRMTKEIRHLDKYTKLIRERDMIPGLSTHMPESVIYADRQEADVETYIQIYNAAGFLMPVEVDWIMKVIQKAEKPVMTIKPLAAGKLMPVVGMTYVWNTIRDQDMVAIGCTTPEEAKEIVDMSIDLIERRTPDQELQATRSKASLV
ncbi:MAG: hypothetical protein HOE48_14120 [Candidatus Latescibacteria bacterium]|jgi:hypothetical protein|nr:hypothetical protein [Candidatus Latescibacterota bacterium]MBT4139051.1 hypothetical protein [Candidatus Latescibacterota bacterium]